MLMKEMFEKEIDRDIQGVIIVGQSEAENAAQELDEYVVTKELQKHFADFFSAYKKGIVGATPKMGVWISGFFGSGKSHFLKILSYLLENKSVGDKRAIDYFAEDKKIEDKNVLADMKLAADTDTDVVLFNIDSKSDGGSKQNKDAIVHVFLKVFHEMQGFCGAMPFVADLERKLTEEGRYQEFKQKFEEMYGEAWEDSRQDFDFIQDDVVEVLAEMEFMSEAAARNWCEKAAEPYQISIEDFAKRVKAYIDRKGNHHHVVFLVDEIGQYIGEDSKLMLNLQTVTEELGKECMGKAWVIVTSQQDIDSVTKVKGNDFSKIQGRFDTRLSLSSANVDEVIKKRILEKKETPAQTLRLLYGQKATIIKNLITFHDGVEKKLYADENDFVCVYPFVPYQFNLLASVLASIRTHGASGKHLSEGERSMLAMFKESAMEYKENEVGTIIPFHAFYDALENFLDHSHRGVIIRAYENDRINPEHKEKVFAVDVLKVLFMIKYVDKVVTANIDNITSLMASNIDDDRIALKEKVEDALKVLIRQNLVQKNGDIYVFLTDEEQEINREIESQSIETAEIINKVSEMIFEDIFTDKKYKYPVLGGRYSFSFNQTVDDRPYKSTQNFDIGVHILTPASDYSTDETTLRMVSGQGREVLAVLPDDRAFIDEIRRYLKIEKFLRLNTFSALSKYESIKEAKRLEMSERNSNAKLFLTESLKEAVIYVNGDRAQISVKDVSARIGEALNRLVKTVYHKLDYIDAVMGEDDIRRLLKSSNQITLNLEDGTEPNVHALDDVLQYVAGNSRMHVKTSMKSIKDRFMKAPYGFVESDIQWLVAKLFKRGDVSFSVNGASVTMMNKEPEEIVNYITKKAFAEKLMLEERIRVADKDKKTVRDILKELFHTTSPSEDEDAVMNFFLSFADKLITELRVAKKDYDRAKYPGLKVMEEGISIMSDIVQIQSPVEFFQTVSRKQDDLLDFAEDYEPIKAFFAGEQKSIFDKALLYLEKYDDSKTYIVDAELENVVDAIRTIIKKEKPFADIPKLPELLKQFTDAYTKVLDEQLVPVLDSVSESRKRVFEVLNTKEYKESKQNRYIELFREIENGANGCTNVSILRGYADRAETLKIRLLNEMDKLDQEIAIKKAEEIRKKLEAEAKENGRYDTDLIEQQVSKVAEENGFQCKRVKNISFKKIAKTSSWHIENKEDVERYIDELRLKLMSELDADTIVNIEF
ncbi:BREX system P-loop protein BrxC [Petralouisia muris]|uniref:BREX system P-loop protein BrxC n=1 Tax=Petralouisia muris TaxID=3032872 RepID=A0AC61S1I5_9FIRM|nr:BREX system P-loop protein BrxC [Petralouisia muris]TGY98248.1 BREX system P-loop protein BrxC [Petralouisia muris]